MSKKYLTASEIATWVRCNRMFYYSRIHPDYKQDAPILVEGTRQHNRHAWNISLQRIVLIIIFLAILICIALFLDFLL